MELITKFRIDKFNKNYIIYSSLDGKHNYAAASQDDSFTNLDTNLSDSEKQALNEVFKSLKEN